MPTSLRSNYFADGISVLWYGLLFGLAGRLRHPQDAVKGQDLWQGLDLYFHAMGGDLQRTASSGDRLNPSVRMTTHGGVDLQAWSEPGVLCLPKRINRYPDRQLNRDLYYWLAAVLAFNECCPGIESLPPGVRHLLQGAATSARLLTAFPSLNERYRKLCEHELELRRAAYPDPSEKTRNPSLVLESAIRRELGADVNHIHRSLSDMIDQAKSDRTVVADSQWLGKTVPYLPVPLWSHRTPQVERFRLPFLKNTRKHREDALEQPQKKAIFDVDYMPQPESGLAAIRDHYTYPEWNCLARTYRRDWCRLFEHRPKGGYHAELDSQFSELVNRVRRRFSLLRQESQWSRFLEDGEELDIDSYVTCAADRIGCGMLESAYYRQKIHQYRDISVIVLMDASRSTEAWVGESRVIDIAKQSMAVLAQVFDSVADDFALYAFSSDSRLRVRCDRIKAFEDTYDESARRNILEVKPQNYTRMGPVIRHLGAKLHAQKSRQKLLIVLSDGKPHDPTDQYEGRYALEDTRKALIEQKSKSVMSFGLTIDQSAPRYLSHLFGPGQYAIYSHLHSLPDVLPQMYARLTDLRLQ
ncbi:MAG: VWA domain-containing protein [Acidiferrobacterales bacterium]|nr:VWA domain-containing protein [Acidiferrobacterales bacterium]